jgi:arylsulfatase A-like enzyme
VTARQGSIARVPHLVLAGLISIGACGAGSAPASPNIVLITIDTLRADHCSVYGYHLRTTPHLEKLAREGARVEKAYVSTPSTGPAHASLFTSRYPLAHQVLKNGHVLADEYPVLAEVLGRAGYRTAAFVSSFVLDDRFGYGQGFESYDDDFRGADGSYKNMKRWEGIEVPGEFDRRAHETTDRAISWLREKGRRGGFFLWVHYMDPHEPYDPPEPWRAKYVQPEMGRRNLSRAVALYDAEIAFTDREVGRLLEALDDSSPPEATLVVLTADHGEGLLDHGFMAHGAILYEETVRIPLIVRWSERIPAGSVLQGPVEIVDVMPTILGLAGISPGKLVLQGRDLTGAFTTGAALDPGHRVFLQRRVYDKSLVPTFPVDGVVFDRPLRVKGAKYGVLQGRWKYLEAPMEKTRELYDLSSDPGERTNLLSRHQELARELAAQLETWRNQQTGLALVPGREAPDEELERLRALGYVR